MTFWAGMVVGVLWGVLLMLVGGWAIGALKRASAGRHRRRSLKAGRRQPLPQLWATGAGDPGPGGTGAAKRAPGALNDYREGQRRRPDFNPQPGPRDW